LDTNIRKKSKITYLCEVKKKSFSDILSDVSDKELSRLEKKVPQWSGITGLSFPDHLSIEQCSSGATALYKARLAESLGCTKCIADLTGGLGVDSWAFSKVAAHILHNEMNPELSAAVRSNFQKLGVSAAMEFAVRELRSDTLRDILSCCTVPPELIFVDPARRGDCGKKLVLLEDCSPDVVSLKDRLLSAAPLLMIKVSPMADISMIRRRLGNELKQIHIVGAFGECKELLLVLERGWGGGCTLTASCISGNGTNSLSFTPDQEADATASFHTGIDDLSDGLLLFEPSAVLSKAACFNLLCGRYGLKKLGHSTHLYTCTDIVRDLEGLGAFYRIRQFLQFDKHSIRNLGKQYPRAEIIARNLPLGTDALRKRMGVTSGGDTRIYAFACDFTGGNSQKLFALTCPVQVSHVRNYLVLRPSGQQ